MVRKRFRHDMKRGLGSCLITLKNCTDIEEYREDIIWGLKNALAYDTQSEGSRAIYLYDMIKMLEDRSEFYRLAAAGAKRCLKDPGWKFAHYAELLTLMSGEGYAAAMQSLDEIYHILLQAIKNGRGTSVGTFPAVDNFSYLCVSYITHSLETREEKEAFFTRVLSDYGRMIQWKPSESSRFEDEWFEQVAGELLGEERIQQLTEQAAVDPYINEYLQNKSRLAAECETYKAQREKTAEIADAAGIYTKLNEGVRPGKEIPYLFLHKKLKEGKSEEIKKLGMLYARETDEHLRQTILNLFRTDDAIALLTEEAISQLLKDIESENESLREEAQRVAVDIQNDQVREYALERLSHCPKDAEALNMLINNYHSGDGRYLIPLVKSVSLNEHDGDWHGIFMDVVNLIERDPAADREISAELLPYMLKEGYCSCCRLDFLEMMQKRGLLTQQIMEACRWDCNLEIREFANNAQ